MRRRMLKMMAGALTVSLILSSFMQVPVKAGGFVYNEMKDISRRSDNSTKEVAEEEVEVDILDTEDLSGDNTSDVEKDNEATNKDGLKNEAKGLSAETFRDSLSGLATYAALKPAEEITIEAADELQELMDNYNKPKTLLKNDAKFYYYYSVLDSLSKEIYDVMYEVACDPMNEGNIGLMVTDIDPGSDEFYKAYQLGSRALELDHPELFWLYTNEAIIAPYGIADPGNGLYYIYFCLDTLYLDFEEVITKFNDATEEFVASIDKNVSEYEIIQQVHDKLTSLVTYDWPICEKSGLDFGHTAYGCFVEDSEGISNYAVCDGYSFAMEYILQQCGVDTTIILGIGGTDENSAGGHAWNMVKVGDTWYELDATWDDHDEDLEGWEESPDYELVKEALSDDEYRDIMDHAYFMSSTDNFRDFTPSEDEYYYFTSKDGYEYSLINDSVHIRMSDYFKSVAAEGEFFEDAALVELAPVAEKIFDPDGFSDDSTGTIVKDEPEEEEEFNIDDYEIGEHGLPIYEVQEFVTKVLKEQVLVEVPEDWGNNDSESSRVSYSPINESGAISPLAGTVSLNYFDEEVDDPEEMYDRFEDSIASMNMVSGVGSSDIEAAGIDGRRIDYSINLGANSFMCTDVLFDYDHTIYVIEIMQGNQSLFDYYPMYDELVATSKVGDDEEIKEALDGGQNQSADDTDEPEDAKTPDTDDEEDGGTISLGGSKEDEDTDTDTDTESEDGGLIDLGGSKEDEDTDTDTDTESEDGGLIDLGGSDEDEDEEADGEGVVDLSGSDKGNDGDFDDMADFVFKINGHEYDFPTKVIDIKDDLNLNLDVVIPYDFKSDEDLLTGEWTEIINTQYFYFDNTLYLEMAGITNMTGEDAPADDCMLTALVDTLGDDVSIELPGGVKVGEAETNIFKGFPKFSELKMDGVAAFVGNELLYACNVRDDGCNGYVLIRNDAPYYSCVSIICEKGLIKEISYECLGGVRANGVFLDE